MTWMVAAVVGVFGAFAVEGLQFVTAVRRCKGWPWKRRGEPPFAPFIASVLIRLAISGGVAAITTESGVTHGAFGAFAVGVGAPLLVEQLARQFPAVGSSDAAIQAFVPEQPGDPAVERAPGSPQPQPQKGQAI